MRDRSAQSFFSISATWSSGSKSKLGGAPSVRTTVLKLSSGPTGAPSQGMLGSSISALSAASLLAQLVLQLAGLGAPPWPWRRARPAPRARILEARADRVALGAQPVDLGLEAAHLAVEREQRVEVEVDALVADRALDRRAVGLDEIHAQHGAAPARKLAGGKVAEAEPAPKALAMPSGLIALLDDVATIAKLAAASVDDVGLAVGKAGTKAAGVVIDDTAVTPRYVTGLAPERELPIIGKIALGSLKNKLLILLPARCC